MEIQGKENKIKEKLNKRDNVSKSLLVAVIIRWIKWSLFSSEQSWIPFPQASCFNAHNFTGHVSVIIPVVCNITCY